MAASLAVAGCAPIEEPERPADPRERITQAEQAVQQQPGRTGKFCRSDQIRCPGGCVSISDDPLNCGDCGYACAASEICIQGACWPESPAEQAALAALKLSPCAVGESPCGGNCVKLHLDSSNCGLCGQTCQPTEVCKEGTCVALP